MDTAYILPPACHQGKHPVKHLIPDCRVQFLNPWNISLCPALCLIDPAYSAKSCLCLLVHIIPDHRQLICSIINMLHALGINLLKKGKNHLSQLVSAVSGICICPICAECLINLFQIILYLPPAHSQKGTDISHTILLQADRLHAAHSLKSTAP